MQLLVLLVACLPLVVHAVDGAQQERALRSAGLELVTTGTCAGGYTVVDADTDACTHVDEMEPPRPGPASTTELQRIARAGTPGFVCDGSGTAGMRVHTIYAHPPDRPNRFDAIEGGLRAIVASVQQDFGDSAIRLGAREELVPRFTHTRPDALGGCEPLIDEVTLPSAKDDDSFGATIEAMKKLGYTDPTRRYLVLMDSSGLCGIGQFWSDDRPNPALNLNNQVLEPLFSRVDTRCWGYAETHELVHNLGGVQDSAPNASGLGHCNDEYDRLCYADGGAASKLFVHPRCASADTDERMLDCNGDDYFHPDPPSGSYLASHWNVADSSWLFTPAGVAVPPSLEVTDGQLDEPTRRLTLTGRATAGSSAVTEVRVSASGATLGTVAPAGSGAWTATVTVGDGATRVRVTAADRDGLESDAVLVDLAGFSDADGLPDGWAWDDVDPDGGVHGGNITRLSEEGVLDGCTGTSFCPEERLRRRDMARFLARALDLDPVPADFDDVAAGDPDGGWIGAVVDAGIAGGLGDGRFGPDGTVSRGQMARFLVNGFDLPPATPRFTDVSRSSVFHDDIGALVAAGITKGCGDGTRYCGAAPVTRGQIATFLVAAR